MYISKIRVQNYKAFYDSGWIEFKPGINIIFGQNHSGKTALLEAISTNVIDTPHRSLKTLPNEHIKLEYAAEIEVGVTITAQELEEHIINDDSKLYLPYYDSEEFPSVQKAGEFIAKRLQEKITANESFELVLPIKNSWHNKEKSTEGKADKLRCGQALVEQVEGVCSPHLSLNSQQIC